MIYGLLAWVGHNQLTRYFYSKNEQYEQFANNNIETIQILYLKKRIS